MDTCALIMQFFPILQLLPILTFGPIYVCLSIEEFAPTFVKPDMQRAPVNEHFRVNIVINMMIQMIDSLADKKMTGSFAMASLGFS